MTTSLELRRRWWWVMGQLIDLDAHRRSNHARSTAGVTFWFDLGSPYTYLAAERVDRMFSAAEWSCVISPEPPVGAGDPATEVRAAALRLPLVWPERSTRSGAASRVAVYAARAGRGAEFVLAAGRLAFCGGFDLEDPEILAEAAAAARLPLDECVAAAADRSLDEQMLAAGRRFASRGPASLPALQVGRMLFCGEHRIAEAAAAARSVGSVASRAFTPA